MFLLPAASPVAALLPGGEPPQVSPGNIQKVAVFHNTTTSRVNGQSPVASGRWGGPLELSLNHWLFVPLRFLSINILLTSERGEVDGRGREGDRWRTGGGALTSAGGAVLVQAPAASCDPGLLPGGRDTQARPRPGHRPHSGNAIKQHEKRFLCMNIKYLKS